MKTKSIRPNILASAISLMLLIISIISPNILKAASVSYGAGDLGVTIRGDASRTNSAGRHVARLSGDVKAKILMIKPTLAEGSAVLDSTATSTRFTGNLKALGFNVLKWDETAKTSISKKFSSTPFTRSLRAGVTFLSVGPIRLKLDVSGSVSLWAEGNLTARMSPLNKAVGFNVSGGPCADAAATAAMSLDAIIAKAWIDGSVHLGKKSILASLDGNLITKKVSFAGNFYVEPLNGAISGHLRVGVWIFKKTWHRTLWSFSGTPRTISIFSEVVRL